MNKQESDILNTLLLEPFINQRILAEVSGHSLGVVNRSLKELIKDDYLDESIRPTIKAITEFKQKTPQRAVILAAGFGMRMVPINTEMPKGLLEVNGEPLIERIIKQLHEVGIQEIYVVVGFMKEKYEYLIDVYGVELVVNADYAAKNNGLSCLPAKKRNISCVFREREPTSLLIVVRRQQFIRPLTGNTFAMILHISTRKMAIKSRNSWKTREYVIL